jgi:hypothetical protein
LTKSKLTHVLVFVAVLVAAIAVGGRFPLRWGPTPIPAPNPTQPPGFDTRVLPNPVPDHYLLVWVIWRGTPVNVTLQIGPSPVVSVGQPSTRPWHKLIPDNGQYVGVGVDVEADGFAQCAIFKPPMSLVDEAHTNVVGFIGCQANAPVVGTG